MNARSLLVIAALVVSSAIASAQPATLDARWADLNSPDDSKALRALLALAATPGETTAFLKDHLKPVKADAKQVAQLVKQLESTNFATRNKAMAELEYLGKYIKGDLDAALKGKLDVETKQRIQQLLDKLPKDKKAEPPMPMPKGGGGKSISVSNINGQITIMVDGVPLDLSKAPTAPPPPPGPPTGWMRASRAVTLLEHLATPEARQILEAMAAGESDAMPTIAARQALERLKK